VTGSLAMLVVAMGVMLSGAPVRKVTDL
jgi:hypothetical protein